MKRIIIALIVGSLVLLGVGCENPVEDSNKNPSGENTLNDPGLNDNYIGSVDEYFYDFEKDVNVKFYRWDLGTITTPILFNPDEDTLNFRTFPEFLLTIRPGDIGEPFTDTNGNGQWDPGEPFEDQGNGVWDMGEPFTDQNGNGFFDIGEPFEDLNNDGYWTGTEILIDLNGDCIWNDDETWEDLDSNGVWTPAETLTHEYLENGVWDPHEPFEDVVNVNGVYDYAEEFTDLNYDFIWTEHEPFTDLNGDGEWTPAEEFDDRNNNGIFDEGEPYTDTDGNCIYTFSEDWVDMFPFLGCGSPDVYDPGCDTFLPYNPNFDHNLNGVYDYAEPFTDENGNNQWDGDTYVDSNNNCMWDDAEPFEDIYFPWNEYNPDEPFVDSNGNGQWDDAEPFTDLNNNGQWDDDEEFDDQNGDGVWTESEPLTYEYLVNAVWDSAEVFIDVNNNGIWDNNGESFVDMNGDCLWSAGETFVDIPGDPENAQWNSYMEQHLIYDETVVKTDSVTINSDVFRHLKQMAWDFELNRYKAFVSDWVGQDTTIYFSDTYDSLVYQQAVTELPEGNTTYYVDESEWVPTSYIYSAGQTEFDNTFILHQKVIGEDSLMFRHNADCNLNGVVDGPEPFEDLNDNGVWDEDEPFTDLGNGILDPEEPYFDRDQPGDSGYGEYDLDEPFVDLNCNGVWDPAETVDEGNGIWDDAEPDEVPGAKPYSIYKSTLEPGHLLVSYDNWPDLTSYRVLLTISSEEWFKDCGLDNICPDDPDWEAADFGEGNGTWDPGEEFDDYNNDGACCAPADSLITRNGDLVRDIIKVDTRTQYETVSVDNVDSLVTVYSNSIIEQLETQENSDYYITKTQWEGHDVTNPNVIVRDYDYHIFKKNSHIYKLVHPSYFLPPGFFSPNDSLTAINGFWYENFTVDEVLFYTPDGNFREGERVHMDTTVSTSIADYYIEKWYEVEKDDVVVPARKVLGYLDDTGNIVCYADEALSVGVMSECPADTLFTNCFKVTSTLDMTMIGPGVQYGEKTITYLAQNRGVVREQVLYRWSDAPWATGSEWIEFSKIELADYRNVNSNSGGLLKNLLGVSRRVDLKHLQDEPALGNDPYKIRRTAGLQRVTIPTNNND